MAVPVMMTPPLETRSRNFANNFHDICRLSSQPTATTDNPQLQFVYCCSHFFTNWRHLFIVPATLSITRKIICLSLTSFSQPHGRNLFIVAPVSSAPGKYCPLLAELTSLIFSKDNDFILLFSSNSHLRVVTDCHFAYFLGVILASTILCVASECWPFAHFQSGFFGYDYSAMSMSLLRPCAKTNGKSEKLTLFCPKNVGSSAILIRANVIFVAKRPIGDWRMACFMLSSLRKILR